MTRLVHVFVVWTVFYGDLLTTGELLDPFIECFRCLDNVLWPFGESLEALGFIRGMFRILWPSVTTIELLDPFIACFRCMDSIL